MNRSCVLPFSTLVLVCLLLLACAPTQEPPAIDESNPVAVAIENSGFEDPADQSGIGVDTDGWVSGGDWSGRCTGLPEVVKEGSSAVRASFVLDGAENGFSQELVSLVESGRYVLSVWISGDARGLVSRAILGYVIPPPEKSEEPPDYVPLGSGDLEAPYGLATDVDWKDVWVEQTLAVDVPSESDAVGYAIWIRFTCVSAAGPRQPEDTDFYGNSVYWDSATLTYYEYLPQ